MSRHLAGPPSSVCDISQLRHSNVYRLGNPPNRGVLRTRRIGWAQRGQRGAAGPELSGAFVGMAKMSCFALRNVAAMSWLANQCRAPRGLQRIRTKGDGHAPVPRSPHLLISWRLRHKRRGGTAVLTHCRAARPRTWSRRPSSRASERRACLGSWPL